jgi:hypothetical protein
MARYFAGNSLAAFFRTHTSIAEDTLAAGYDATYVSNSVIIAAGLTTDYIESWAFSATGTVYLRFDMYNGSGGIANNNGACLYNGATGVFRVIQTGNPTHQCQYWNGSAWTNTGSTFNLALASRHVLMAKVTLGSGFELYDAGTIVASGSGWSGGGTTVTAFRGFNFASNGNGTRYSQVMIADYDIRDAHLMSAALNGNSATNTGGTGTYTDVNETVLDESTAEIVATVGNKMGQTKASITLPSGLGIAAMVINARGRVSGGTVTDGKLGIRSSGTNYSSSGRGYNGGYEPRGYIAEANPSGSVAWTQTTFNSAEPYLEAS